MTSPPSRSRIRPRHAESACLRRGCADWKAKAHRIGAARPTVRGRAECCRRRTSASRPRRLSWPWCNARIAHVTPGVRWCSSQTRRRFRTPSKRSFAGCPRRLLGRGTREVVFRPHEPGPHALVLSQSFIRAPNHQLRISTAVPQDRHRARLSVSLSRQSDHYTVFPFRFPP